MTSYTISDTFSPLKEFALSLPQNFNTLGSIIQDSRNVIKMVKTPYGNLVIKNFKGMYFFNRLAYSLFRRSKASRSYLYADILRQNGVITPTNVAWINRYTFGLLTESYYVSVYYPYPTLAQYLNALTESDTITRNRVIKALASFSLHLHYLGIYHDDFSASNILVIEKDGEYEFGMVDLNRIKFGKISFRKGLQSFSKLSLTTTDLDQLITNYALMSDQAPEAAVRLFWNDKNRAGSLRAFRKKIRRYTLTPLEKMFKGAYLYLAATQFAEQLL